MTSPSSQINANVATAHALVAKLRHVNTPLTMSERLALAALLDTIAARVNFRPADEFDANLAWTAVSNRFGARMRLLGDHNEAREHTR